MRHPLPEHSQTKSPSALSRFLNINPWSTREMIRIIRTHILERVLSESRKGRRPFLWTYLSTQLPNLLDWGEAAQTALECFFPQILVSLLLLNIERLIPLARSRGFDIQISRCKI